MTSTQLELPVDEDYTPMSYFTSSGTKLDPVITEEKASLPPSKVDTVNMRRDDVSSAQSSRNRCTHEQMLQKKRKELEEKRRKKKNKLLSRTPTTYVNRTRNLVSPKEAAKTGKDDPDA